MDMMPCPHCGAANSKKRLSCYQCAGDLLAAPKEVRASGATGTTCASCLRAMDGPPLGQWMATDHVWCTVRDQPIPATTSSGECFEQQQRQNAEFGWQRNEILD
jgi:hypothetical protein